MLLEILRDSRRNGISLSNFDGLLGLLGDFGRQRDASKAEVVDNDGIPIFDGYYTEELGSFRFMKILFSGHENVGAGIELKEFWHADEAGVDVVFFRVKDDL